MSLEDEYREWVKRTELVKKELEERARIKNVVQWKENEPIEDDTMPKLKIEPQNSYTTVTGRASSYTWETASPTPDGPSKKVTAKMRHTGDGLRLPDADGYWVSVCITDDEPSSPEIIEVCNGASEYRLRSDETFTLRAIDNLPRDGTHYYLFIF